MLHLEHSYTQQRFRVILQLKSALIQEIRFYFLCWLFIRHSNIIINLHFRIHSQKRPFKYDGAAFLSQWELVPLQ